MSDSVLTEVRGRVLVITLNRPDVLNAIDSHLGAGLLAAVARLDTDSDLAVGVLTGAGRGFCAGMDLKTFLKAGQPQGVAEFFRAGTDKPLIAAVEGFAVAGGLELALTCDLIVGGDGSRYGIPEVAVGLFASGGALIRLPSRVAYSMAMRLALTGEMIDAQAALAAGLVTEVVPKGRALAAACALAERIAQNAPLAVRASKQIVQQSVGLSENQGWSLSDGFVPDVFDSADAIEGSSAFAEKRSPQWIGK